MHAKSGGRPDRPCPGQSGTIAGQPCSAAYGAQPGRPSGVVR